ncbi:hypothetical protein [Desulfonatronovibrio hydrogenovorans]|uniref:hypothetical protein n=1 Tax=Desulfonatronovibrio hydrogenovorans TaxID=53245 RepID=UPI000491A206|nr:hypothetical protein [Desulfonatronovibrio hydrogenovorans]
MDPKDFNRFFSDIRKHFHSGKASLERKMPGIEAEIVRYAGKIGLKEKDIEDAKNKVREKLKELKIINDNQKNK